MKLVKIFANKNFKNIEFNDRFNVVLAVINDKINKKDTHNLGKTYLTHVIDFVLLSTFDKKIFGNKIFQDVVFYGELELNNGKYLIIKRAINAPTKISFKLDDFKSNDFNPPLSWDINELAFKRSQAKLNEYFGFDVVENYDYRKSITYFLRTQQDYLDVYKLDKFRGKHIDWKPFVFELLGYNSDLIINKLTLENEIEVNKNRINVLREEAQIKTEERDKLAGLLDIKLQELDVALETIDKFDFFEQDKNLNKNLIENIDDNIQLLNTDRYRISYEINKTEESLSNLYIDIKTVDLEKLYEETKLYFPATLKREFSDLIQFNASISKERKKFLTENLKDLRSKYKSINKELKNLESEKSIKLEFLTEKDSYDKFKTYQKQLSTIEADVYTLKNNIGAIDQAKDIEERIKQINIEVESAIAKIREAVNKREHAEINKIFNNIIYDILGTNAVISIDQNKQGNIEYHAEYQSLNHSLATSEDKGTTYRKLLCMAFDLSLLIHYRNRSYFRFVYHDGILEGLDNRIKIRLLQKVKDICEEYDIQYILSLIDSDIPTNEIDERYEFSENKICLTLNDADDSGKLFMHSF